MSDTAEEALLRSVALRNAKSILLAQEQRSHELLLAVLANSIDAIITCDDGRLILSFNEEARNLFGYTADEVLGRDVTLLVPDSRSSFASVTDSGRRTIVGLESSSVGRRKDGSTFPIDLGVSHFLLNDRRHFNCVVRDITERRKLEEQLRQAQKMDAVGQLAGGVAHDFNNLLTVISGCSELIWEALPSSDPNRELLRSIMDAGEQAATLTRRLLAFSRKQVLEPRILNLNDVVSGFEGMIRRLIGEDIRVSAVLDLALRSVKADPGQLEQVLINLAVNARDAMPRGGSLTVETRNVELGEEDCRDRPGCVAGSYVMLGVSDTGCGMTPEVQAHIFEPFFTTKEVGKGTGLGLAMVYGVVKQSGGYVEADSTPGVGTSFRVYLPQFRDAVPVAAEPARAPRSAPRGSETLLLVEDEDGVRRLATRVLEGCGYSVIPARDGAEAIRLAESHVGPLQLLVSDVVMPKMSGSAVAERVAALRPGIRMLFTSGYMDDAVVRHGIVQAEIPFLQKPFSPSQLARKVREVLDKD